MDIRAEKLTLIKWIIELDDPGVIKRLIVLQQQLQRIV